MCWGWFVCFVLFFPRVFCPPSVDCSSINFPSLCETTSTPALGKQYCRSTAIFRKHPLGTCWSWGWLAPVATTLALLALAWGRWTMSSSTHSLPCSRLSSSIGASEWDFQSGTFSDLPDHCITDLLKKHLGLWEEGNTEWQQPFLTGCCREQVWLCQSASQNSLYCFLYYLPGTGLIDFSHV